MRWEACPLLLQRARSRLVLGLASLSSFSQQFDTPLEPSRLQFSPAISMHVDKVRGPFIFCYQGLEPNKRSNIYLRSFLGIFVSRGRGLVGIKNELVNLLSWNDYCLGLRINVIEH